ncbi:MAG: class I SAM-dependent methyltransferase [Actinomycetota bacterium]|nr:class I SAM-dependent methyltransferase [Actinomycetota bacterium]
MKQSGHGSRPFFAAWYDAMNRRADRGELGKRRQALFGQLSGRVLDVGIGTAETVKHVPLTVSGMIAVEPDPAMVRRARQRLDGARVPVRLVRSLGERLPFGHASFDAAVVALVLCTVDDPDATLAELHRVVRPGGKLFLMEHVRATDDELAAWQDRLARPWAWLNGGCRPNRRTLEAVEAAGFRLATLERYGFPALPHVQGFAVRP